MPRILITCLALALVAPSAHAGIDNAGTTAGNFLSVGTGASVLSMGGATLATGNDLHAAAWNPAALALLGGSQFALSHATLAQQSAQDLAAVGGRLGRGQTRWAASALYQGDGSFDGRDALGGSTGTFNVSSMALGVQLARPLGSAVTAGVGARWLSDNLGDSKGTGVGFDAGLQAHAGSFGLGLAARNVGGSMSYASGRFDLPSVYGVGASWNDAVRGLRLALDANFPHAYYNDVRLGAEWRWQDRVALRAGYRMELGATTGEPLGGPTFGLGAGVNGMWMDYAFLADNADAQGQHRIGLTFHPGFLNGMGRAGEAPHVVNATDEAPERVVIATPPVAEAKRTPAPAPAPAPPAATPAPATSSAAPVAAAPVTPTSEAPAPAPAPPVTAPRRASASADAPAAFDVSDRVPPGGAESESPARDIVPTHVLAPSDPVRVAPLAMERPTGSIGDDWVAGAAVAAPAPQVAVRQAAPARKSAVRPVVAKAPVVAPVAVALPVVAAKAAPAVKSPKVAPTTAAAKVASPAPVALAPTLAPSAPAATVAPAVLAANHPAPPARAVHVAPSPKPVAPAVSAPAAAPESSASPAPPQAAPAAAPDSHAPAKPAKSSPWPTVSATIPSTQLAGSSAKVAVVPVPAGAPTTEPIAKAAPASPAPRPAFVNAASNETLDDIAKRWDTTVPALMMENNLVNTTLKKGQKLKLPPPQRH